MGHKPGYSDRCAAQLDAWVLNHSLHNDVDDECCPDFSCCLETLWTPDDERQRFAAADDERHGMLMTFLGRLVAQRYPAGNGEVLDPEGVKVFRWGKP